MRTEATEKATLIMDAQIHTLEWVIQATCPSGSVELAVKSRIAELNREKSGYEARVVAADRAGFPRDTASAGQFPGDAQIAMAARIAHQIEEQEVLVPGLPMWEDSSDQALTIESIATFVACEIALATAEIRAERAAKEAK